MNQQYVNKTNNISNSQTEKSAKIKQEKHTIYVMDLLEQHIKDQQLQKITKKYGKKIDQEIRKDGKEK